MGVEGDQARRREFVLRFALCTALTHSQLHEPALIVEVSGPPLSMSLAMVNRESCSKVFVEVGHAAVLRVPERGRKEECKKTPQKAWLLY